MEKLINDTTLNYSLELNVDGHFPKDFDDLAKVAVEESDSKELEEFKQWLNNQTKKEKSRILKIIEGIKLQAERKNISTANEFILEQNARAEYRLRRLKKDTQTKMEPDFASDIAGIKHILMTEINQKNSPNYEVDKGSHSQNKRKDIPNTSEFILKTKYQPELKQKHDKKPKNQDDSGNLALLN